MARVVNELGNKKSLESLIQEVYRDANCQIKEVNDKINELLNSTNLKEETVTIYDKTQLSKGVGDLLKIKNDAIRNKVDLCKISAVYLNNSQSRNGDIEKENTDNKSISVSDVLREVRELKNSSNDTNLYKTK